MPAKTFSLCGQTVTVSEAYDAYNTLRLQFIQEASGAAQEFGNQYDAYGNIDNVVEHGLEDGFGIIAEVIDRVVINGVLMNLKIYDIDARRFFEDFYQGRYFHWEEDFGEVQDSYMSIRLEQKQLDEYRTMRRQTRSRWVGGGFGIGGALKGAAKAGAMNMASGALHGLFNAGAKVLSMADESSKKSSLYRNAKKGLMIGILRSVYEIHFAVWDMLEERGGNMYVECLASGAAKKAEAIRNNFVKMPREEVLAVLPQVFLLDPYSEDLYKKLFLLFGDKDGGLQKAAEYFGVDTSFIAKEKDALAERIFADVKNELGKSEQAALDAKKKFELALKSNAVDDTESARKNLKAIENKLRDYDVEARTVEGEIFPSRPEADNVRKAIDEFERSFDESLYKKSAEHARRVMENLTSYDSKYPLVAKHVESKKKEVDKALKEFDLKARTITYRVNTRTFDTREEAEKAHNEAFVINGLLQGLNYEESEADAKEALRKLEGYTPECRIVFDDYMKKLQDLLNSFDREASTVSFSERSIVLKRDEAENVKAMPEFSELVSGWEKYKTERTDGRLSHIADLLQKMPQKIRESYWGMMSEFEASKKETADRAKIRIGLKSFLWYVAAVAGLVFFARYWQGWEWVGLKGVAAAFMLIVPIIAVVNEVNENGSSTDENPNLSHDLIMVLLFIYWEAAILTLTLPSWNSYSTAWQVLIVIAVLIIVGLIGIGIGVIQDAKKKATENARKAIEYLKDFEQLSSQSTEYRNFKTMNKK